LIECSGEITRKGERKMQKEQAEILREALLEVLVNIMRDTAPSFSSIPRPTTRSDYPFVVGESYFIRTVTYHMTGRVKQIVGHFLVLEDAAWIAEGERFMQAINEGKLNEVEPVKTKVLLNIETITDAFPWIHHLPRDQK
jgi:hypothetical protein